MARRMILMMAVASTIGLVGSPQALAAGFFDDDRARRLIPDHFAVVGAVLREQPHEHLAPTGGEDGVLGLAVHADRLGGDAHRIR